MSLNKGFFSNNPFFLFIFVFFLMFAIVVAIQYSYIKTSVDKISCKAIRNKLQKIIEQYKIENNAEFVPFKEINIKMLKDKNYSEKYLYCPGGGVYKVNMLGDVYCTKHSPEKEDE